MSTPDLNDHGSGPPSALKRGGSTSAWRRRRREVIAAAPKPLRCHTCAVLLDGPFDIGHVTPRALGGGDDHLIVQCQTCNRGDGSRLAAALRAQRGGQPPNIVRPKDFRVF